MNYKSQPCFVLFPYISVGKIKNAGKNFALYYLLSKRIQINVEKHKLLL